ncbi:MAG: hypothetical protein ACREU4_06150, partial [Burkholderiales bacterium]
MQRGIDGLTAQLSAREPEAARDQASVLEALSQVLADTQAAREEIRSEFERVRAQTDAVGVRDELAGLAGHVDEQGDLVSRAVEEIRGALAGMADRLEGGPEPIERLQAWLEQFSQTFERRVAAAAEDSARSAAFAQRSLTEQGVRLENLREVVQAQSGHAGDRVAALLEAGSAGQRELLATLGAATTQLSAEATTVRDAMAAQIQRLEDALQEAVAAAQTGLDDSLGAAQTVSDRIGQSSAAARATLAQLQNLVKTLIARVEDGHAEGARQLAAAAALLEDSSARLEPTVTASVSGLLQTLLDTAEADRAQSEQTKESLHEAVAEAAVELRGVVETAARELLGAGAGGAAELSDAAAGVVRAAEDLQPAFSAALAKLYGAVAGAVTQVQATTEDSAARTDAAVAEALAGIERGVA